MRIPLSRLAFGMIVVALGFSVAAQLQKAPARAPAKAPANSLTADQVIDMTRAGLSEDVIIAMIKKNGKAFDLSVQQLLRLKQASVSDNVIQVMLDPSSEGQPVPAAMPPERPPDTTAVPPTPAEAPSANRTVEPPVSTSLAAVPDENGIYWIKGRELVRIEGKALSNIRTGSILTHSVTLGIKRMRINAQIKGPHAEQRIREKQPRFYLYLPEDASAGDYLLVRLVQRPDLRQLEVGESKFFKTQAGVDQTMEVEFSHQRVKPRLYLVIPKAALDPGEYGFYPAAGSSELKKPTGRIYDFGIDP